MSKTIICFGEVLFDLLPSGKIAGGAPMNVAYHANNFGLNSSMISRVGADGLGRELMEFLTEKGISTSLVQTDPVFPTGIVNVTLDEKGSPSYEIVQPSSWDFIEIEEPAQLAVQQADALVFGSLACRTDRTKHTLLDLLELARTKVFDVNLRPPFFDKNLLELLLPKANIVKMNDEELDIIAPWCGVAEGEEAKMALVKNTFQLDALVMTRGANGAALLTERGHFSQKGFKVTVQDTIGSGDAFLGAFLSNYLNGVPEAECLEFACAAGAFVASQKGATPVVGRADVEALMTGG